MSIKLSDELQASTTKGKIASANQVFLNGDSKNLQTVYEENNEHFSKVDEQVKQLQKSVDDIAVSGGASVANAVTYDNSVSGLKATTVQSAIDELTARASGDENGELRYVDRGEWEQEEKYYCEAVNPDTKVYEVSDVWYKGCKYRCCKNLPQAPPAWNNTDWKMIEGNPNFVVSFNEPESLLDLDNIDLTLTIVATFYNMDITADILDSDIVWERYSEDAQGNERIESDKAWGVKHVDTGKSLHLTKEDMDFNGYMPKVIKFTAAVTLRDGKGNEVVRMQAIYNY